MTISLASFVLKLARPSMWAILPSRFNYDPSFKSSSGGCFAGLDRFRKVGIST